jgi:hypothetical protein
MQQILRKIHSINQGLIYDYDIHRTELGDLHIYTKNMIATRNSS